LHVFDPMAQSGLSGQFISGTNIVPDPCADDGSGLDLFQSNPQSVWKTKKLRGLVDSVQFTRL